MATEHGFGYDSGDLVARAGASADRAIALDSSSVESYLARGKYLSVLGDHDGAYGAFESAARVAPADPEVLMSLGMALEKVGRLDDALSKAETPNVLDELIRAPKSFRGPSDLVACLPARRSSREGHDHARGIRPG